MSKLSRLSDIIHDPISGEWGDEDETGSGTPVLRTTNFTNEGVIDFSNVVTRLIPNLSSKTHKFLKKGDIIIEKSGGSPTQPVGRVVYFDGDEDRFLINNFTSILRVKDDKEVFQKFLCYFLMYQYRKGGTKRFQNKTTGILNLKLQRYLYETNIFLPSLLKQKQIASVLDTTFGLLKLRKRQLEELDQLIKSVFYEMFGDPVKNEKGWTLKKLGHICEIVRGGSPRPIDRFLGGTVPWIKIGDATEFGDEIYLHGTKDKIIEEGVSKSRLIPPGSLIFANCGVSLGFARIITFSGCIHDGWLAFNNIDEYVNKIFLLKQLNERTEYFRKTAPSGTQPNLNTDIMKNTTIVVPPLGLQNKYADIVTQIESQKTLVKQSIDETQRLFDSLMSKYFDD